MTVTWAAAVSAIGSVATPLVVATLGFYFNRRVKALEDRQWRNQELIRARLEAYKQLAGPLNDLMCYFTFIGSWKLFDPPEIVTLKRSTDRLFFSLAPLFDVEVRKSYDAFMTLLFKAFGSWGEDAKLRTGYARRSQAHPRDWDTAWSDMFTHGTGQTISESELLAIRDAYSAVLASMVRDIDLTRARTDYATALVVANAH